MGQASNERGEPIDGLWLGVDVGTQGVRAVLVDGAGTVHGSGAAALPPGTRDGRRHEQDPEDWWRALCSATRQALADLPPGAPLDGLAIDSTSGTLVVQDLDGTARGAALMYDDGRAQDQAGRVQEAGAALWATLGYRIQPAWALPKVRWLLDHDALGDDATIAHQGDHLAARLVGHRVPSDTAGVLKTGYDLLGECWPADVLDRLGIPTAVLPDVVRPGTRTGEVSVAAAEQTGIPAGTPVMAGSTDGCAAQVAARALAPGSWSSALGTTLVVKGSTPELLLDPDGAVYCHRNPDGGWLPGGASSSGAGAIERDLPGGDLEALTASLGRELPAGFPVAGFVYPSVGRGERFPFSCPDARPVAEPPATAGARSDAHVLAGLMQAVAFVERLAYDVLRGLGADTSGPVTFSGGATRNETWNQLRCDTLGRPVLLPGSVQAALGAAVVAAAPPGRLAETAERMVRIERRLEPDDRAGARLAEAYGGFVDQLVERSWLDPQRLPADMRATRSDQRAEARR